MCGICGFTGELLNRDRVLKDMADKIIHRGPDSCGYFSNPEISMGFRRLSIIDLEATIRNYVKNCSEKGISLLRIQILKC